MPRQDDTDDESPRHESGLAEDIAIDSSLSENPQLLLAPVVPLGLDAPHRSVATQADSPTEEHRGGGDGDDNDNDDDNDDNETVIFLDSYNERNPNESRTFDWMEPDNEEHRRAILHQELHRVQRSAFLQFAGLCLFPLLVSIFVIFTAVNDKALCGSSATICFAEPRTFLNAFTTRCVCDPIHVLPVQNSTKL